MNMSIAIFVPQYIKIQAEKGNLLKDIAYWRSLSACTLVGPTTTLAEIELPRK